MDKVQEFFDLRAEKWDSFSDRTSDDLKKIIDSLDLKIGEKVLDVGCGTGVITSLIAGKTENQVLGIDVSPKMIEVAKSKNKNPNVSFEAISLYDFKETDFDKLVFYDCYPHFLDLEKLKLSIFRILKLGGTFIIIHDCGVSELNKHHETFAHDVSRNITHADEEAKNFTDSFELVKSHETENSYLLVFKKH